MAADGVIERVRLVRLREFVPQKPYHRELMLLQELPQPFARGTGEARFRMPRVMPDPVQVVKAVAPPAFEYPSVVG